MSANVTIEQARMTNWDVIIIGAGPAGATTALNCARAGLQTLLLDAHRFPRDKVCGGCLNARSIAALRRMELGHLIKDAVVTDSLSLYRDDSRRPVCQSRLHLPLPKGVAIERAVFDELLVKSVQQAGGAFLDEASATVIPDCESERQLDVVYHGQTHRVAARVVICADGLGRNSIRQLPEFTVQKTPRSRIGLGATVTGTAALEHGAIQMVVTKSGYVGMADVGEGRVNIAAAVDPRALNGRHSAGHWIASALQSVGMTPPPNCDDICWRGTPPLTCRLEYVAAKRLFLVGDAAGYVEPFTGEGMAWAFECGQAVAPLIEQACVNWRPSLSDQWHRLYRQHVGARQGICRILSWTLQKRWALASAMQLTQLWSWPVRRMISSINEPTT